MPVNMRGRAPQWPLSVLSTIESSQIPVLSCVLFGAPTRYALLPYRMFAYSGMTGEQVRPLCLYVGHRHDVCVKPCCAQHAANPIEACLTNWAVP